MSSGTATLIDEKKLKSNVLQTTAYIMLGEKCRNNCHFCTRARESDARPNLLSRITWPEVAAEEAAAGITAAYANDLLRRACLQIVHEAGAGEDALTAIRLLRANSAVPVCVSGYMETPEEAQRLVVAGADRICIALDAATPAVYGAAKEGDWHAKWRLLVECAAIFPGRITTHLIVGLGESEEDMAAIIASCVKQDITVGLFAFTPVKGTAWAARLPPDIGCYRRIQIAHHLLKEGYDPAVIRYRQGRISAFDLPDLAAVLTGGAAFQTSGCPGCNRPFYNERPGGVMYNYPWPLSLGEFTAALEEWKL